LDENGKYLFLVVDSRSIVPSRSKEEFTKVHNSLVQLAWMANDTWGEIAIFACGSSASLCCLFVTCYGDRNEFPTLNLNLEYYDYLYMFFTDVNVIENITDPGSTSLEMRRLLAFGVGINPRKLFAALRKLKRGEDIYLLLTKKFQP
jgi:hypothetical protein